MNGPCRRLAGRRWPARSRSGLDLSGPAPSPGRIMEPALPLTGIPPERTKGPEGRMVGIPISGGDDPVLGALRSAAGAGSADAAATRQPTPAVTPAAHAAPAPAPAPATATAPPKAIAVATAVGLLERQMPRRGPGGRSDSPSGDAAATERCAEERRLADERCELATRARAQADAAIDALRARPAELRRARSGGGHGVLESGPARRPRGQGRGPGRVPMPRSPPRPVRTSSRRPPGTG